MSLFNIFNIFNGPKEYDPKQHGIYMFINKHSDDSEHTCLLLYKKCDHNQLAMSLPISYNRNNGDYVLVIFENGHDYLCQSTYNNIIETINKYNMVDIDNNEWSYIKSQLPLLEKEEYINSLRFAKEQIKI